MAFYKVLNLATYKFLNIVLTYLTMLLPVSALQCNQGPCSLPIVVPSSPNPKVDLQHFSKRETTSNELSPIMDPHLTDGYSTIQDDKNVPPEPTNTKYIPDYMFDIYNQKIHKSNGGNIFDNVRIYRTILG